MEECENQENNEKEMGWHEGIKRHGNENAKEMRTSKTWTEIKNIRWRNMTRQIKRN